MKYCTIVFLIVLLISLKTKGFSQIVVKKFAYKEYCKEFRIYNCSLDSVYLIQMAIEFYKGKDSCGIKNWRKISVFSVPEDSLISIDISNCEREMDIIKDYVESEYLYPGDSITFKLDYPFERPHERFNFEMIPIKLIDVLKRIPEVQEGSPILKERRYDYKDLPLIKTSI